MTLEWRPPVADPAMRLDVEVDPSGLVNDANRDNNSAAISFAVAPSPLPNLVAIHTGISVDPDPALQHETVHITATVTNPTDNDAGAFTVRIWIDEIGAGVLIGETTVAALAAGEATTVEADWLVDEMADRLIWLDVDPNQEVPEFNEDDNRDFRILDVSTIPDLVMTSGQVSLDPRFPRTGDVVHVEVAVLNTGDQPANGVEVELAVVGGAVVGATTIPVIDGGEAETIAFDWPTDGVIGEVALRITADPSDTVAELDETNNAVEVAVAVQDDDLWVTERYISPNGDGVKDETTIFVRDGVAEIEVIDPWGEVVQTLDVDPTGGAVWNGRKDNGAAVRDGVYEARADGLTTWVEVDLNSVTITDDVRQPLIIEFVSPLSASPGARFTTGAISPVDGIVYLAEKTGYGIYDPIEMRRWNGEVLEDVPDWPEGFYTNIRQISADETVFITWNGTYYSLLRFPGPEIDPLTPPGPVDTPHLSPDGRGFCGRTPPCSRPKRSFVLQSTADLASIFDFGPYQTGSPSGWSVAPTVHWAPDGTRVVATLQSGVSYVAGVAIDITLDAGATALRARAVARPALHRRCCLRLRVSTPSPPPSTSTTTCSLCIDEPSQKAPRHRSENRFDGSNHGPPEPGFQISGSGTACRTTAAWWRSTSTCSRSPRAPPSRGTRSTTGNEGSTHRGSRWGCHPRPSGPASTVSGISIFGTRPPGSVYLTPAANLAVTLDPIVRFGGSGIDLYLTVTDRNLDFYQLEIAPASSPDAFEPLGQPARGTILGENWGTWIPPAQGTWRVRLTAVDLAGNERSVSRWVTWNGVSDIAGLWTESRFISPVASPGVQDQMVWQYTVLRPAQLLFEIVDANDALIRSIPVGASQPGPMTTMWDGLDDAGRPVPDGAYRLTFRGAEWPVTVDNTPPAATFEIADNGLRPTADEIAQAGGWHPPVDLVRSALFNLSSWSVADDNLDSARFESRHIDTTELDAGLRPGALRGRHSPHLPRGRGARGVVLRTRRPPSRRRPSR